MFLACFLPFESWAISALSHCIKLQLAGLVHIRSSVAAKITNVGLLAQPAAELDRPLDPGSSPWKPQAVQTCQLTIAVSQT